ncbi:glycosyltransferase [Spirosoma sp. KNUC1025]|nr:glycosyltransferase [Spirosoma sp. KNUC1025]
MIKAYLGLLKRKQETSLALPKLVIAGPGLETSYGLRMQKLVADCTGADSHIFFTGMLSDDTKWGAFYGCEAFILPSHQENFGIAIVEALACSKPVLISDQVNIWREIMNAGSGIVVADTLEGTEQAIFSWLNVSSDNRQLMGRRAYSTFTNNFAIAPATRRLLSAVSEA